MRCNLRTVLKVFSDRISLSKRTDREAVFSDRICLSILGSPRNNSPDKEWSCNGNILSLSYNESFVCESFKKKMISAKINLRKNTPSPPPLGNLKWRQRWKSLGLPRENFVKDSTSLTDKTKMADPPHNAEVEELRWGSLFLFSLEKIDAVF